MPNICQCILSLSGGTLRGLQQVLGMTITLFRAFVKLENASVFSFLMQDWRIFARQLYL